MIKKFKTYNEEFSFDKIESEEIVIDINDYAEEYDNIFKDKFRCVKAVGPIHQEGEIFNVKDLFKGTFGMWITSKSRYDVTEKFKIIKGFDCDIEFLQLKKGNYIMIWPGKQQRINDADPNYEPYPGAPKRKARMKGSKENSLKRLSRIFSEHNKIFIPANRVVMYNLVEYLRDAQEKLIGGYFWETSSGTVVRGTTDKRYTGKQEEIVITRPRYIYTNGDHLILKSQKVGGTVWDREKETYLDINKPIYGKMVHWIDPELDPYGEEEWDDEVREITEIRSFDKFIPTGKSISSNEIEDMIEKRDVRVLNEDYIGRVMVSDLPNYYIHITNWIINNDGRQRYKGLRFYYDNYYDPNGKHYQFTTERVYYFKSNITITTYKEIDPMIIIDERDPYGEEDWREYVISEQFNEEYTPPKPKLVLDRTLNFSDFLRFDLLGLKKLNLVRDFMLEQIVIIKQGHNNARTKGRVYHIKPIKIDGDQYYEIKMTTKQGDKSIIIGDADKFKVKPPKQIKYKIDPCGEEDWELLGDDVPDVKSKVIKGKGKIKNNGYFSHTFPVKKDFYKILKDIRHQAIQKEDFEKFLKEKRKKENEED